MIIRALLHQKRLFAAFVSGLCCSGVSAQTDIDGLMMQKHFFCTGLTTGVSSFKNYWEGDFKRDNANFGRVTTGNIMLMGNYGITDKLNAIVALPHIKTKASAGVNAGQQGLQDMSLTLKWAAWEKQVRKGTLTTFLIGGYSLPTSRYNPDFLPLSIGLRCRQATARLMADYQVGHWTLTASGSYIRRSNVTLDRNTYYTTQMHYSNEVRMPDVSYVNLRLGYRSETWIAELTADRWATLGGFDIPKNGMPFVSNNMDATRIGFNLKYETDFVNGLSFIANGSTTIAGRNIGQAAGFNTGVFYIFDLSPKQKTEKKQKPAQK